MMVLDVMRKKRLLLINGSQVFMDVNKRILERSGYSVSCAIGIIGAREMLEEFTPDGIILANDLPDGSGLDYLLELLAGSGIPVIFLSDDRNDEVTALNIGANDFLRRPFDYDVLKTRIELMLNRNSNMTAAEELAEREMRSDDRGAVISLCGPENVNTEDADSEPPMIGKRVGLSIPLKIIAACAAIAVCVSGIIALLNNPASELNIPGGQIPLADYPVQTSTNNKYFPVSGQNIEIFYIDRVTVPAGATDVVFPLRNPENNPCYIVYELLLMETMETLYKSDMLAPGTGIEVITITGGMLEGENNAVLIIQIFSLEDSVLIGSIRDEIVIVAE